MRGKRRETIGVGAVLFLTLAGYAWLFATGRAELDYDECYLAMQGLDILNGARPVFFPSQDYMGCVEGYLMALFHALTGSNSPLTVKLLGAAEAMAFLLSSWWLVRRFFSRGVAFVALLLLAFPPALLAIWLLRVRGYLPALILGNGVFYALFSLLEEKGEARRTPRFALLGVLLGLAWWANPISIYYAALVAVALLRTREARNALLAGVFRSPAALFVNAAALAILAVLESRSLVAAKRNAILEFFFEHRAALLGGLAALAAAAGAAAALRRKENYRPAALCAGFLLGNVAALRVYWTVEFPNLKQAAGGFQIFWGNLTLSPIFVFPGMAGLRQAEDTLSPIFPPLAAAVFVVTLYALLAYYIFRSWRGSSPSFQSLALFVAIILLLCFGQNTLVWHNERYLLPLYLPVFTLMALLIQDLYRLRRWLGVTVLGMLLAAHLNSWRHLPAVEVELPLGIQRGETMLLDYCRARGWDAVFLDTSDTSAYRLTYFSNREIVFLYTWGYSNRIPRFEELFRSKTHLPLICLLGNGSLEKMDRPPDDELNGYVVFYQVPREVIRRIFGPYFL